MTLDTFELILLYFADFQKLFILQVVFYQQLLLYCLTATFVSDFTTMVSSHSPAVKSKVFAGPKATKKAAQTIYDLKLKESSAAAIKTAGLIFLDKLAQLLRSKNQGSGRRTLDPLMTSHVCDRLGHYLNFYQFHRNVPDHR